jgi:polyribonucleotide nucleotidyltransferase|tara:strand:- start:140 stop:424 length:285 start_codon:yes stop_codon:yes gene_type:complete
MNAADRKEFELIHEKIDNIKQDITDMKKDMSMAHGKTEESLRFMKENLFNPHEGLWAETKQNTQFRENSQKWRGVIGVGFVGLLLEKVWSLFTS